MYLLSDDPPSVTNQPIYLLRFEEFSQSAKNQLLWSRCVNTLNRTGTNILCNLHMEHLNQRLKTTTGEIGSNVNPQSIMRAGKAISLIH